MHRYFVLVWNPEDPEAARSARQLEPLIGSPEWTCAYRSDSALVVHAGVRCGSAEAYQLHGQHGIILGAIFRRGDAEHTTRQRISFDSRETIRVVSTRCKHLLERYWGRYVAVVYDREKRTHYLLRDPTANMPFFYTQWNGVNIFFSHCEDVVRFLPVRFSIDWQQLLAHMCTNYKRGRRTGLAEVEDIPGGELVSISAAAIGRSTLWHPAIFCERAHLENAEEAAGAMRAAVLDAVNAWSSCYPSILHCLSGGLDSSIVGAALAKAQSRPRVTCLNVYIGPASRDIPYGFTNFSKRYTEKLMRVVGHGDERVFARLLAERYRYPLLESERRIRDFALKKVWDAPLDVLPSRYVHNLDQDDAEIAAAKECGADAVFNGQAGDTIFFATLQSAGAIDYVFHHAFGKHLAREIRNSVKLSRESLWLILWEVFKYGVLRQRKPVIYDPLKSPHLVKSEVFREVSMDRVEHPWILLAGNLSPGKRSHVEGLANGGLYYHHVFHRERIAPSEFPLASQPVVETCMQIPVYTLLAGGVSRGLARRAFSDLLPPEISSRTTKGFSFTFYQEILQDNMSFVRESLLDGLLVRNGILDREKADAFFVKDQPFLTVSAVHVLIYLAAEAWLRQWTGGNRLRVAA